MSIQGRHRLDDVQARGAIVVGAPESAPAREFCQNDGVSPPEGGDQNLALSGDRPDGLAEPVHHRETGYTAEFPHVVGNKRIAEG